MKKTITVILTILAMTLIFTSCGKTESTKKTEELIKAIDKTITLDSKAAIDEALKSYNMLNDEEKAKVGNYSKLEKAQAEYDGIIKFNEDVTNILAAANSTFNSTDNNMTELLERYEEMKKEYSKMDKTRKEQVTEDYSKLEEAVEKLKKYNESANESAAVYVKAFNKVNEGKKYEILEIGCIKQLRNEKEYHMFAIRYKDANGNENCVYSKARISGSDMYDEIIAHPDEFFADEPAVTGYDPLADGNITIDVQAAVSAAENIK